MAAREAAFYKSIFSFVSVIDLFLSVASPIFVPVCIPRVQEQGLLLLLSVLFFYVTTI